MRRTVSRLHQGSLFSATTEQENDRKNQEIATEYSQVEANTEIGVQMHKINALGIHPQKLFQRQYKHEYEQEQERESEQKQGSTLKTSVQEWKNDQE